MRLVLIAAFALAANAASAGTLTLEPSNITEWKAVYGRIEARDTVPARARIGGTLIELSVTEGDTVAAGQKIATVQDDKLTFQIAALDAQIRASRAQLDTAETELERGQTLVERGVMTVQRLDQLRTQVDVVRNQIASTQAQRSVIVQQQAEGDVLAPAAGRVLTVPVTRGAVILAGENVATIGGGGIFLRLAIPERHAELLEEGSQIRVSAKGTEWNGRLAKIYPQIENGRVIADVEVENLDTQFVDARVLVEVPVGSRNALLVPADAVTTHSGIDFVKISENGAETERAVVIGKTIEHDGAKQVEILTGLRQGDVVVTP